MGAVSHASATLQAVAWSRRHSLVFGVAVLALSIVPWTVRHWPSQDGPNHLAIAHVIAAYAEPGSPVRWFVHLDGECSQLLLDRRRKLEKVVDRYDYVLMLDPPEYGRDLLPSELRLVSRVGSAWLYAIAHSR